MAKLGLSLRMMAVGRRGIRLCGIALLALLLPACSSGQTIVEGPLVKLVLTGMDPEATRVVGGWAQRRDSGEIFYRLFEDIGRETQRAVEAEADRIGKWLGPVRVIPRFRTPTEIEIAA